MFSETACKVLGFIALVIIGSYLFRIIMNYNTNKNGFIIEGFGDDDTMTDEQFDQLKAMVGKIKTLGSNQLAVMSINRPGMRQLYEDVLKSMDTFVGAKILGEIFLFSYFASSDAKLQKFDNAEVAKMVNRINMMSEFQQSINRNLTEWLDNQGDNSSKESDNSKSMW